MIVTINDKEVMTSADFSVGVECTRKLVIIRGSMQCDMGTKIETDVCVKNRETSTNIDHSGENSRSRKLNLVPMTRLECQQALLANKITYPEPEYLVASMILLELRSRWKITSLSSWVGMYLEICVTFHWCQTSHT
jgi:hypothetical protein